MTPTQIENTIRARRLPMDFTAWMAVVSLTFFIGGMVYLESVPSAHGERMPLFGVVGFSVVALLLAIQKLYVNRALKPYLSEQSSDNKAKVLDYLLTDSKTFSDEKKQPSLYRFRYRKSWLTSYTVLVLYDDHGYYVNSLSGYGASSWFSDDNVATVIHAIKKAELVCGAVV